MTAMANAFIGSKTYSDAKRTVLPKRLTADSQHRGLSPTGRRDAMQYQVSETLEMGV